MEFCANEMHRKRKAVSDLLTDEFPFKKKHSGGKQNPSQEKWEFETCLQSRWYEGVKGMIEWIRGLKVRW